MAVVAGKDYVFTPHLRTVLKGAGVSRACALVTRQALYMIPYVAITGGGVTITRTTVTIGGMPPADYIARLLADPQMTPEGLDTAVGGQCAGVAGAVTKPLTGFRRIKIRSGFFGRGVYMSERPDGVWGQPFVEAFGWRPAKQEMPVFSAFFAGDQRLV